MGRNEEGIALVAVIFITTVTSLLVLEMGRLANYQIKTSKAFLEGVQAEYILKSGAEMAKGILAVPELDLDQTKADHPGQLWNQANSLVSLVAGNRLGDLRIEIVDDYGKFNLSSVLRRQSFGSSASTRADPATVFLLEYLIEEAVGGDFSKLTGTLVDFIDADKTSYQDIGVEDSLPREKFYNRELYSLQELLLVEGYSPEIVARLGLFFRIGAIRKRPGVNRPPEADRSKDINLNTAPEPLIRALEAFTDNLLELPSYSDLGVISSEDLKDIRRNIENAESGSTESNQDSEIKTIKNLIRVRSKQFSAYIKVKLANSTHWAKATFYTPGTLENRKPQLVSFERL